jgi:acetylornithine deacetylase
MINFHLDVVPANPASWTFDPWKATVKDGILYGRGACDMKGGAAAALFAVKTILESGIRLKGDLIVAGVVEEEGPGMGALAVQARGVRADACIVPEPTSLSLTTAVTGGVYGTITVSGRSSHATSPWNGVNAIEKASVVLQGFEAWRKLRRQIPVDSLYALNPDTPAAACVTNIARTDGGSMGVLPWIVTLNIRATVMPGEDPNDIARDLKKTILSVTEKDSWLAKNPPVFALQIWGGRSYPASLPTDHALSRTLSESFSRVVGKTPEFRGLVSPADMQILINVEPSTPALMFGPGDIKAAHSDDEGVPIEELCMSSAVISDFILNWCK